MSPSSSMAPSMTFGSMKDVVVVIAAVVVVVVVVVDDVVGYS